MIHLNGFRFMITAIDDCWHFTRTTQAAARTLSLQCALVGTNFYFHRYYSIIVICSRPNKSVKKDGSIYSMNSELNELSLLIRNMVSASRLAMLSWQIRSQAIASSRKGIVSVTTNLSRAEFWMRSTALPDNTACVE